MVNENNTIPSATSQLPPKLTFDKAKAFIADTLQLFKTHTWQVVAIMAVTAALTSLIVVPIASASKKAASVNVPAESSQDDKIETWGDCAHKYLDDACHISSINFPNDNDAFPMLRISVSSVGDFDRFMLGASILGDIMSGLTDKYPYLSKVDAITISFCDSALMMTTRLVTILSYASSLDIEEDNPQYADITKYYNKYLGIYDVGLLTTTNTDDTVTNDIDQTDGNTEDMIDVNNGSGTLGKYNVSILSYRLGYDYAGRDVIFITYTFVNNSNRPAAFGYALDNNVYQNGAELEGCFIADDDYNYDSSLEYSEIKPGVSLTLECAYILRDKSPVEVEVSELISYRDEKVSKTFNLE